MRKTNYEQETETSSGVSNKLAYLLIGGGIGAVVALLFAPKTGRELRGDIADVSRKGYDKTLEGAQYLKENSGEYLNQAKEQANSLYARGKDAYSSATQKFRTAKAGAGETITDTAEDFGNSVSEFGNQLGDGVNRVEQKLQ